MGEPDRGAEGQRVPALPSHPSVELETESSPWDSASREVKIRTFPGLCLQKSLRQVPPVPPRFQALGRVSFRSLSAPGDGVGGAGTRVAPAGRGHWAEGRTAGREMKKARGEQRA